jgi:hypothetical protein
MLFEGTPQHQLWANDLDLGGPAAVYVEDNTFTNTLGPSTCNFLDGNYGGRYVARYNTMNGCVIEAHSSQESGNRAIRSWEVYGNIINNTFANVYYPFRIRGGTGMVFFNSVPGNWTHDGVAFDNVRSYAAAAQGGGLCNGGSPWDGNQDSSGYPCRDQIGRSKDAPQWTHLAPVPPYTQALVPAYVWLNRTETNVELPVDVINNAHNHIRANRDYYAYTPSFTGATGVGCGPLSARPATCTTGVAWWATEQSCSSLSGRVGVRPAEPLSGTLYRCTAPNTWTSHYTPYTYPHPQQNAVATPDRTPPSIALTAPASGATVSGTISVAATASDDTGVVGVQFKLNGLNLGLEDTVAPFALSWKTTSVPDGEHTLSAVARDASGNAAVAADVRITVSNAGCICPVASYSLDEGTGTVALDGSGNSQHGTLFNGPTWMAGKYGTGLRFDGNNDYMSIGTQILPPTFTISTWIYNAQNSKYETIISFGTDRQFSITSGSLAFWRGSGPEHRFGIVPNRSWQHVAFTFDGSVMRAYLNGAPLGAALNLSLPSTTGLTLIGAWPTANGRRGDLLSARLDDIRIYGRALTEAQIQSDLKVPLN